MKTGVILQNEVIQSLITAGKIRFLSSVNTEIVPDNTRLLWINDKKHIIATTITRLSGIHLRTSLRMCKELLADKREFRTFAKILPYTSAGDWYVFAMTDKSSVTEEQIESISKSFDLKRYQQSAVTKNIADGKKRVVYKITDPATGLRRWLHGYADYTDKFIRRLAKVAVENSAISSIGRRNMEKLNPKWAETLDSFIASDTLVVEVESDPKIQEISKVERVLVNTRIRSLNSAALSKLRN